MQHHDKGIEMTIFEIVHIELSTGVIDSIEAEEIIATHLRQVGQRAHLVLVVRK